MLLQDRSEGALGWREAMQIPEEDRLARDRRDLVWKENKSFLLAVLCHVGSKKSALEARSSVST